jgi:lipopolysaccharide biosynthesis regulator YciM
LDASEYLLLLVLAALGLGVALGRLWGSLARRNGTPRGPARIGESIHYILGLDYLAAQQIDRAIAELTRAVKVDTGAIEIYLILGNLFREKGQLERAIQIHQSILHRPRLSPREKAHALLCLGVDFKRAGFPERAAETFEQVLTIDPGNAYGLLHLQKIREEEQDWQGALGLAERRAALTGVEEKRLVAFLHHQVGLQALAGSEEAKAARSFEIAVGLDRKLPPAYLHLADLREKQGRFKEAAAECEALLGESPEHAYLAFDRLERLYQRLGEGEKILRLYRDLAASDPWDWRANLALGRLLARAGRAEEAFAHFLVAVEHNPHALEVHLEAWNLLLDRGLDAKQVKRYLERTERSIFFRDPHLCTKCRYRTSGMTWRCPHCQEWNTFVEERVSARRESI